MSRARTSRSNIAGRTAIRSAASVGGRSGPPSGGRYRRTERHRSGTCGQSGNRDHPDRLRRRLDPVKAGLVASLDRPGGNVTGVSALTWSLTASGSRSCMNWCPAARFAVLVNPDQSCEIEDRETCEAAARAIGLQIDVLNASTNRDIDAAFASLGESGPSLLVAPTRFSSAGASTRDAGDAPWVPAVFCRASLPKPAG